MFRRRRLVSLAAATATVAAMTIVSLSGPAGAAPRGGYLRLAGSAAPFTSHARVTGAVAGSVRLTIQVWLRPGDLAAAQRYATAVSTPGSALFHHYLSPDAYTARFGASQAARRCGGVMAARPGVHRHSGRRAAQLRAGHRGDRGDRRRVPDPGGELPVIDEL